MRRAGYCVLAAALGQCAPPTAVRVEVRTDLPCGVGSPAVLVAGIAPAEVATKSPSTVSAVCSRVVDPRSGLEDYALGDVVLSPAGAEDRLALAVGQRVDGASAEDCTKAGVAPEVASRCIVARRELRLAEGQTLPLRIDLRRECLGTLCAPDRTCVRGACQLALFEAGGAVDTPPPTGTYRDEVLADRPVLYWRLDELPGALFALDSSGNSNTGTFVTGVTLAVPSPVFGGGTAARLVDGVIKTGASGPRTPAALTVELWCQGKNPTAFEGAFIARVGSIEFVQRSPDILRFGGASVTAPPVGTVIHMVGTWDGTTSGQGVRLYLNGILVARGGGGTLVDTAAISVGRLGDVVVDEVAVYPHVLPAERVAAHYAAGAPR